MGKMCGLGGVSLGAVDPTVLRVWGFCICKWMKIPVSDYKTDVDTVEIIIRAICNPNMT